MISCPSIYKNNFLIIETIPKLRCCFTMEKVDIKHKKKRKKIYFNISGEEGILKYKVLNKSVIDIYSTYIPNDLRGKGLAKKLIQKAVRWATKKNYKIKASCPYVDWFLNNKKEYALLKFNDY